MQATAAISQTTQLCTAVIALLCLAAPALADGKLYAPREKVPPGVPYQRAFIMFQEGVQTMVLQTAFAPPNASGAKVSAVQPGTHDLRSASLAISAVPAPSSADAALGWVVPLPSVPELAAMREGAGDHMFRLLDLRTMPTVTRVSDLALLGLLFVPVLLLIGFFILLVREARNPGVSLRSRRIVGRALVPTFGLLVIVSCLLPSLAKAGGGSSGIEIVKSEQVGVFDATVLRASNSDDLVAWLNDKGFEFTPSDRPVLDEYIRNGWCFVTAVVRAEHRAAVEAHADHLIDPLVMRFATAAPVYPLALTATVGSDTEILLYLLTDAKRDCAGRLPIRAARTIDIDMESNPWMLLPEGFKRWNGTNAWLCKFKGTMTPEQMRQDLFFSATADSTPYREHIVRW